MNSYLLFRYLDELDLEVNLLHALPVPYLEFDERVCQLLRISKVISTGKGTVKAACRMTQLPRHGSG